MEILEQTEQLFWHGKYVEALALLEQMESQETVSSEEWGQGQVLKARILVHHDITQAQPLITNLLQMNQELELPLLKVDALLVQAELWWHLWNFKKLAEVIYQAKAALVTLPQKLAPKRTAREAQLLNFEVYLYQFNGFPERALECAQQSLALTQQMGAPHAIAWSQMYIDWTYCWTDPERGVVGLQKGLKQSEPLQIPFLRAFMLQGLGWIFISWIGNLNQAQKCLQEALAIFEQLGVQHWVVHTLAGLCKVAMWKGDLNHALELGQRSLALCMQLNLPDTIYEYIARMHLGWVYSLKGELDLALKYLLRSLTIVEPLGVKTEPGLTSNRISHTYLMRGNLEAAYEYALRGLRAREELGATPLIIRSLLQVIIILVELGERELAHQYEQWLLTLSTQIGGPLMEQMKRFAQALVFKASPRGRDKIQAQLLFQQIADEEIIYVDYTIQTTLHLCDLLFFEFKASDEPVILQELHTLTQRLLDLAKDQKVSSLLAETYGLQAKLALLHLDLPRAQQLLTQAQILAEDKGLEKLAQSISHDYDTLLMQLPQWEALQAQEAPLAEARELSGVESYLTRLVSQRVPDPPELTPETEVLLLIVTEGGLPLFTHPFQRDQVLDEHLIGGFLTALSNFGQDALATSGAIDRILYDEFTIAIKPLEYLRVCYIFQGSSYLALQKLDQFMVQVQASPTLLQPLSVLKPQDTPVKALKPLDPDIEAGLELLITKIFTPTNAKELAGSTEPK